MGQAQAVLENICSSNIPISEEEIKENIRFLSAKGADINKGNKYKIPPLINAILNEKLELIRALLKYEMDVNIRDTCGNSALHFAASDGNMELVKLLVENGVDVNAQNCWGDTALSEAAAQGNLRIVKYLLEKNANHWICNNKKHIMFSTFMEEHSLILPFLWRSEKS